MNSRRWRCGFAKLRNVSLSRRPIAFRSTPFHLCRVVLESPVNPSASQRTAAPALICPRCEGPVNVSSRHIAVDGPAIRVYCSEECLQGIIELDALEPIEEPPRRTRWWITAGMVVGGLVIGGTFAVFQFAWRDEVPSSAPLPLPAVPPTPAVPAVVAMVTTEDPPAPHDEELLHELMQDAWIHPLAGPKRRMPINHTAAFGAERQGQPPPECLSGHC